MIIQSRENTKCGDCGRGINQTPEKLSFPLLEYELSANDESNRYKLLLENATGIEYAPDPSKLGDLHLQITPFIEAEAFNPGKVYQNGGAAGLDVSSGDIRLFL